MSSSQITQSDSTPVTGSRLAYFTVYGVPAGLAGLPQLRATLVVGPPSEALTGATSSGWAVALALCVVSTETSPRESKDQNP